MDKQADVAALRERLLDGMAPFGVFCRAIGKHPTTVRRLRPPIVKIGRSEYVHEGIGRAWLLNSCRPVEASDDASQPPDEARPPDETA